MSLSIIGIRKGSAIDILYKSNLKRYKAQIRKREKLHIETESGPSTIA